MEFIKSKPGLIVIGVVAVAILGVVIYFVWQKNNSKKGTETETTVTTAAPKKSSMNSFDSSTKKT